jgi:uncharacterized protein (TIGR03067 family)
MKLRYLVIVTAGLLLAADAPQQGPAGPDYDRLQGAWGLVSVEVNGQPVTVEKLKEARLKIRGESYGFRLGETALAMTYRLRPAETPKAIDLTIASGRNKGKTFFGIYKLEGDTYTVCRPTEPGKDRPRAFVTKPGSGLMLVVWKRQKA